jgi:two-component system response regulator YesN
LRVLKTRSRSRSDRAEWSLLQRLLSADALEHGKPAAAVQQRMFMALLLLGNYASPFTWKDAGLDASDILGHFGSGLNGESGCYCVTIDGRRRMLLLPADNEACSQSIRTRLQSLCQYMETRGILLHVSFGIKKESESLNRGFVRLGKQLEEHLRIGVPTWAAPEMKPAVPDIGEIWVKVRALQAQIKAGDMARGRDTVSRIVTWLQCKEVTQKQLTQFATDLFYSLKFNLQSESKARQHEDLSLLNEVIDYEPITEWLTAAVFGMAGERESKEQKPERAHTGVDELDPR